MAVSVSVIEDELWPSFHFIRLGNVPRVDGQLAMTRALETKVLKSILVIVEIHDDTKFLILASDGLWKVVSNKEAWEQIKEMGNAEETEKVLIDEALARGSKDDISCVLFHSIHRLNDATS